MSFVEELPESNTLDFKKFLDQEIVISDFAVRQSNSIYNINIDFSSKGNGKLMLSYLQKENYQLEYEKMQVFAYGTKTFLTIKILNFFFQEKFAVQNYEIELVTLNNYRLQIQVFADRYFDKIFKIRKIDDAAVNEVEFWFFSRALAQHYLEWYSKKYLSHFPV